MGSEAKSSNNPSPRKLRFAATLLAVALALLAWEAFNYFSAPPLDEEQKALLAWEGVRAPDFSVTNLDGQPVHLANLKGKRVILNFWATWCVPCLVEMPDFIKLRAESSPTNVVILGLSTEDEETLRTFVKRNGVNYSVAQLKNVPSPYRDIVKIPATLVIDRNGVIQHVRFGPQDFAGLNQLAAGSDFAGPVRPAPSAAGND